MRQLFKKNERLSSRKEIGLLFQEGQSFNEYPYRITWKIVPYDKEAPVKVVFSVSKKRFKRAVDRNLIKRRSREAYRKNNQLLKTLCHKSQLGINMMFIYRGDEIHEFKEVEHKIILILQRLADMNE